MVYANRRTGNVVISDVSNCIDPIIAISLVTLISSVFNFEGYKKIKNIPSFFAPWHPFTGIRPILKHWSAPLRVLVPMRLAVS